MFSRDEISAANEHAQQRLRTEPRIVKAHYDEKMRRVVLVLNNDAWFAFRPADAQGLENATLAQLKRIEITPSTFGVYFPLLDEYLDLPALMQGHFGTRKWMAARLGAAGGSVTSKAKTSAARANGKLGGRPRKSVAS
jgi:hypothetical protein